ncbi:MAG TPA: MFS transporter [Oscillospiraceae bacterium]|nr:MFS transporter [Oscillospiraceae bacterium]
MTKSKSVITFAVMSVFFVAMGIGTITPAIQSIAEAFPDIAFSTLLLVSTLPSLLIIPATLFSGAMAGTKIGYRPLLIVAMVLFIAGGVAPAFMNNFTTILVSRAVFGIGIGLLSPLGNALVLGLFDGQQRANMLGLGGVIMNLGGIAFQMLGGLLAAISWRYTFLAHGIAVASLLVVLFLLPEPKKMEVPAGPKATMPLAVYLISLLFGLAMMLNYPMLVNMSTIIISGNLGTAASAGMVLSMFTVGGMLAGSIFGKLHQLVNRFTISVGLLITALGMALVYYANSLLVLTIGSTGVGIGFGLVMPAVMMVLGMIVPPHAFAIASGILMAVMNAFAFLSTYYLEFIARITGAPAIKSPIFIAFCAYVAAAVIYTLARLKAPAAPSTADDAK